MKKERQIIFDKYEGKCAYCGHPLTKSFHIDHLDPMYRGKKLIGYSIFDQSKVYEDTTKHELDNIENMMPSCVSCNLYKSTYSLEQFREQIGLLTGRLSARFSQYKIAKRFGLVIETENPVIFYFENFDDSLKSSL